MKSIGVRGWLLKPLLSGVILFGVYLIYARFAATLTISGLTIWIGFAVLNGLVLALLTWASKRRSV